jgi:ribokinase
MAEIVVVGSLNMDLVVKTHRFPSAGETVVGDDLLLVPGGKGANQAAAAARLGGRVAMVGRVGGDVFGQQLRANLECLGVDIAYVVVDVEAVTGTAMVVVDGQGENRIIISAGANGRVSIMDVDRASNLMKQAQALVLQFEIPIEAVERALQLAAADDIRVILNPAPSCPISPEFLRLVDCLVLNETEAQTMTGLSVKDLPSAQAAARQLVGYGVPEVILTLGERGALLMTVDGAIHVPARKVRAIDTTAAGDAFIGALAVAGVKGFLLEDAVRYATCAGTLAVTKLGAQTSLPTDEEVQRFFRPR